jgi:hypothetical protein
MHSFFNGRGEIIFLCRCAKLPQIIANSKNGKNLKLTLVKFENFSIRQQLMNNDG